MPLKILSPHLMFRPGVWARLEDARATILSSKRSVESVETSLDLISDDELWTDIVENDLTTVGELWGVPWTIRRDRANYIFVKAGAP